MFTPTPKIPFIFGNLKYFATSQEYIKLYSYWTTTIFIIGKFIELSFLFVTTVKHSM